MDSDKYDNREDESMKHLEGQPMLYPRNDDNFIRNNLMANSLD